MSLQIHIPASPLSDYVHTFWAWEGYNPPHDKERILPHGTMELVINLNDEPFCVYDPEDDYQATHINGIMASGARTKHFVIDTSRPTSLLSVWFKAGGSLPFFGVNGRELQNQHLSLDVLWGHDAHNLYDQLLYARTTDERFCILENALMRRLMRSKSRHPAVEFALSHFRHAQDSHSIAQVVDQLALSPTRFIQVFREDVGVTPKRFCRILRFQKTLHLITSHPLMNWADIALDAGYYDQAHLINDFQAFAGISPTAYAPQDPDHRSNLAYFDEG